MFAERREAGEALLERIPKLDTENTVVLALPRGGLPVAEVIADALGASLDIVLARKVGFPGQPEFAIAAVTDGDAPRITVNEDVTRMDNLNEAEIRKLAERELPEQRRRREIYVGSRAPFPLTGKNGRCGR
jgi:putative phosphoribosyl transferase